MEVAKLGLIFCIIVVIIWLKYPLYLAMTAGILGAILLFQIPVTEALLLLGRQTIAWETIDLLLSFYVIIFLQLMMEKKGRLKNARDSFDHLLRNRRLNTIISPAIMGLLPSAAVMTICADMVDKTCEDYLDAKSKTFVSCFYRHIPEMFLPTFPVILLAMSLSGQNVGLFILSMIPLVILACLVVYFTYLRKIPREMPPVEGKVDTGRELMALVRNLWTLILVLAIIIVGNISATFAGAFVILLNYFVDHFRKSDLKDLIVRSAEPVLLGNMYLVMLFKGVLAYTGVLGALPDFFRQFPISLPLSFFLLFFFGTIIGGSQAVVALCMPIAMTAIPDEGLPFLAMLMGAVWAAMELSPTHVCAFVAADYYHTTFADLVAKALPSVILFSALCYGYGRLLMFLSEPRHPKPLFSYPDRTAPRHRIFSGRRGAVLFFHKTHYCAVEMSISRNAAAAGGSFSFLRQTNVRSRMSGSLRSSGMRTTSGRSRNRVVGMIAMPSPEATEFRTP